MVVAGLLSSVVPGLGQLYRGATRRGLVLLAIAAAIVVSGLVIGSRFTVDALPGVDRRIVAIVLLADLALLAFRVFAVVDAARGALPVIVLALVVLTAMPHVAAAWVTVRSYDVLESVFADEEPCGTSCDRGTLLLSHRVVALPAWVPKDAWEWALVERLGPGEVAPLQADARVLADEEIPVAKPWTTILLLGTDEGPGNWGARTDTIILAAIQHGTGRAAAFGIPRNLAQVPLGPKGTPFKEPINALYGRDALAYVRSRKESSDYTRMARQRCFLSALADQLDPVHVLRNFGSLAKTVETNVHTDIPLNRLPSLVRLVGAIEPKQTLTVTFGLDYFFNRQKNGNYPVPNLHKSQATVRNAILDPELLKQKGTAKTTRESC